MSSFVPLIVALVLLGYLIVMRRLFYQAYYEYQNSEKQNLEHADRARQRKRRQRSRPDF